MRTFTGAVLLLFVVVLAFPRLAESFLPPVGQGSALARPGARLTGRMAASDSGSEVGRKEKSREAVRSLLKGLGELDDDEDDDNKELTSKQKKREKNSEARKLLKDKVKLDPEVVFYEGPPHWSEVVVPAISILTVIGIIPFAGSVARQLWCRYKVTSRRVSVSTGVGGKDMTEVIYPDIAGMNYVFRSFGATGDMVLFLRDGAKLEMRSIPNFRDVYNYIRSNLEADAQDKAPVLPALQ